MFGLVLLGLPEDKIAGTFTLGLGHDIYDDMDLHFALANPRRDKRDISYYNYLP